MQFKNDRPEKIIFIRVVAHNDVNHLNISESALDSLPTAGRRSNWQAVL